METDRRTTPRPWVVSRRVDTILVAGLTIGAAISPALELRPNSLWLDDAWPALVVKAHSVHDVLLTGGTAPGFALLMRAWLGLTGFTELHSQILPFLAGVVTPPLLYMAVARCGLSRRTALIAAAVIAAAPARETYSTHVKQYSMEVLVAIAFLVLSTRLARPRAPWWLWPAAAGFGIAATAFSASLGLVAGTGLVVAAACTAARREHIEVVAASLAGFALFGVAWWAAILRPAVNDALREFWSGYFIDLGGRAAVTTTVTGVRRMFFLFAPAGAATMWMAAALFLVGVITLVRRDRAIGAIVGLPVASAFAAAAVHAAPVGTRTDQYLYVALALGVAVGVDALLVLLDGRSRPTVGGLTIGVVIALASVSRAGAYPLEDLKPLVRRVEKGPADAAILVYRPATYAFGLYTRSPIRFVAEPTAANGFIVGVDAPRVHILPFRPDHPERYAADIAPVFESSTRIWFVASHLIRSDDIHIGNALYENGYRLRTADWTEGAYAMLWERD